MYKKILLFVAMLISADSIAMEKPEKYTNLNDYPARKLGQKKTIDNYITKIENDDLQPVSELQKIAFSVYKNNYAKIDKHKLIETTENTILLPAFTKRLNSEKKQKKEKSEKNTNLKDYPVLKPGQKKTIDNDITKIKDGDLHKTTDKLQNIAFSVYENNYAKIDKHKLVETTKNTISLPAFTKTKRLNSVDDVDYSNINQVYESPVGHQDQINPRVTIMLLKNTVHEYDVDSSEIEEKKKHWRKIQENMKKKNSGKRSKKILKI